LRDNINKRMNKRSNLIRAPTNDELALQTDKHKEESQNESIRGENNEENDAIPRSRINRNKLFNTIDTQKN